MDRHDHDEAQRVVQGAAGRGGVAAIAVSVVKKEDMSRRSPDSDEEGSDEEGVLEGNLGSGFPGGTGSIQVGPIKWRGCMPIAGFAQAPTSDAHWLSNLKQPPCLKRGKHLTCEACDAAVTEVGPYNLQHHGRGWASLTVTRDPPRKRPPLPLPPNAPPPLPGLPRPPARARPGVPEWRSRCLAQQRPPHGLLVSPRDPTLGPRCARVFIEWRLGVVAETPSRS